MYKLAMDELGFLHELDLFSVDVDTCEILIPTSSGSYLLKPKGIKKLADSGLTKINGWKHLSHVYYQPNSIPVSRNSVIITPERQFSQILHRLHIRCSPTVHLQCHATFCCNNNRNPSLRILTAAFTSRSCSSPQHGHFQCLILKSFTASFRYPQSEHI